MAANRIADMTVEELRAFVEQVVEHRLKLLTHPGDNRPIADIYEEIDRNLWTPPASAKSSLVLLREDRDA